MPAAEVTTIHGCGKNLARVHVREGSAKRHVGKLPGVLDHSSAGVAVDAFTQSLTAPPWPYSSGNGRGLLQTPPVRIQFPFSDTVNREPEIALFESVVASARAFMPDAIVGLGGGSPLDVAKLVAALLDGRQAVREVFGVGNLRGRHVYLACVPTTAGSGSEVSPNAVLIDEQQRLKKGAVSPHLVPDVAFLDPVLTVPVPPAVTAAVGIDALVHCMEGYANNAAHPVVDVYAIEGIRRIGRSVAAAVAHGDDLSARTDVILGSFYGGLCLGPVNTAAVHALSSPLGGEYRIAHGVANSLLMPHVFRFNLPAMP
ncbi:MAG: iron-containing alcohol dehydrogenase, partial [Opitutaceae bacterium]